MLAYFEEDQRFTQWWIYLTPVFMFLLSGYITVQQLVFDRPVGNNPMPDDQLWIVWLFTVGLFWLLWSVRLVTVIDSKGIHVRLRPFTKASFTWDQISKVYLREYKPLREFGGYGLRYSRAGKAYNIRGNKGIQIELKNGKKVLIGTQEWARLDRLLPEKAALHIK